MGRFPKRYPPRFEQMEIAPIVAFEEEPMPESKRPIEFWIGVMNLSGGLLTALPAALPFSKTYPRATIAAMVTGLTVFVVSAAAFFFRVVRSKWKAYSANVADLRFIAIHEKRMQDLLNKFHKFIANHDARSLRQILMSAQSANVDKVGRLLGTSEHTETWADFLRQQLQYPTSSFDQFLLLCREFTTIISDFDRHQVQRAQKELTSGTPLQAHYIDQLEEFKDEFNAFLRSAEEWIGEVAEYAKSRQDAISNYIATVPAAYFERVKSFKRADAANA